MLGPLHHQRVAPIALARYHEHAYYFYCYLMMLNYPDTSTEAALDLQMQDFLEYMWDNNAGLSAGQQTVAGVCHLLRHAVRLRGSWRLLGVWRRAEPPARAPPMPERVALALAMHALRQGDPAFCVSVLIGFYAYLRTAEIVNLCVAHCYSDRRGNLIPSLGMSKSGKRRGEAEYAMIVAGPIATLVSIFLAARQGQTRVCDCAEWLWRVRFDRYLAELGLDSLGWRPYSLRRGGATHAFVEGLSMSQVCVRGRWAHESTARMYIQEAVNLLQQMAIPAAALAGVQWLSDLWSLNLS